MERPHSRKRGYDAQWERLRAAHLSRFPWCAVAGCGRRAVIGDHKIPVSVAPQLRLAPDNVQSLCRQCHNRLTVAYDVGSIRGACDDDGAPLDSNHPWNKPDNRTAIAAVNGKPDRPAVALAAQLKRRAVRQR